MFRISGGRIEVKVPKIPPPFPARVYATTVWPFVFYEPGVWDDECVQAYERRHWIDQIKWLVIPWLVVYLLLSIKYGGGRKHPFEKPAYEIQDTCEASRAVPARVD
ncbi:MAG: hypothetical protein O3B95_08840 [Chloroflexi bacterium]|nr:hypothetical protein [Chloroflexota bacterium]